jgi:hypothetical protein
MTEFFNSARCFRIAILALRAVKKLANTRGEGGWSLHLCYLRAYKGVTEGREGSSEFQNSIIFSPISLFEN